MPTFGEHKTAQARILTYAKAIGWTLVPREEAEQREDIAEYMQREVLPHVPDAWVDESKTKVGYEINFNRYFYKYQPPRPLGEIEKDLRKIEGEITAMLAEGIE